MSSVAALGVALSASPGRAGPVLRSLAKGDWPQILGPNRNGIYTGPEIVPSFPRTGPPPLWKRDVGAGFAGPAVAGDRLILFHRVNNRETVEAMDANTGKTIWTFDYPTSYRDDFGFDEGPRAVPVIAGGRVFTHGADGMLHGIDFASGKMLWSVDTRKVFEAPKGYFGVASSPVVDGTRVLVNVGGKTKGGIVAFDAASGKTLWTATSDEPSYSAPIVADIDGQHTGVFFTRTGLVAARSGDRQGSLSIPLARAAGRIGQRGHADRHRRSHFPVGELRHRRGAAAGRQQRGQADLVRRRIDVESLFDERAEGRLPLRIRRPAGIRADACAASSSPPAK